MSVFFCARDKLLPTFFQEEKIFLNNNQIRRQVLYLEAMLVIDLMETFTTEQNAHQKQLQSQLLMCVLVSNEIVLYL